MTTTRSRFIPIPPILSLAVLLTALPLAAQPHPNQERGFAADKAYSAGEVDSINLFNGNLILTLPVGGAYPAGGGLSYGLTLVYNSQLWRYDQYDDGTVSYTVAEPSPRPNSGMGWQLTLGRLYAPTAAGNDTGRWLWSAPDGADHAFYDKLHEGDPEDAGDSGANQSTLYTRDNTYLRLKLNVVSGSHEVEFPGGAIHRFRTSDGQPTQLRDRFGNAVNVAYFADRWEISDPHGRVQKVRFASPGAGSFYPQTVSAVELTAFGSATATYSFGYTMVTVAPTCRDAHSGNVTVPLLTSVGLPDGSSYQMPASDYYTDTSVVCEPGTIKGLKLPTLGKIDWTYGLYKYPVQAKPWLSASTGVVSRTVRDAAGSAIGAWTYSPLLEAGTQPKERTTTVSDPLGHATVHYFSVSLQTIGGWTPDEYGLPFSRYQADATGTRFVSTQTYAAGASTPLRSTYVRYERDQTSAVLLEDRQNRNRRLASSRTVFHDDGNRYAEVTSSLFDGLGHYRQEATGGSFGAGDARTAFTNFNPAQGTYSLDANGNPNGTFTMLAKTAPWVLGTYSEQTATEGGATARRESCFEAATGYLQRTRTLKSGTAAGANDLVSVFTRDAAGLTTREQHYGGDLQSLGTGALCSLALPADAYRIDHTYQSGVRATSRYLTSAGGSLGFYFLNQTIDARTGLVAASTDVSGIRTDFTFDTLGRITWVKPQTGHGRWTEAVHTRATSSSAPAKVRIYHRPNGGGTALAEEEVQFEAFGRVKRQGRKMPGGTWSYRDTLYTADGWVTWVSEAHTGSPSTWTKYQNFDPFGRPTRIRPSDGSVHDVTLVYYGTRQVVRKLYVGTVEAGGGAVTETQSTTTDTYDRQGRLWKVAEPSGAAGAVVTTTYGYDVGGRLRTVSTTSGSTQTRTFNYDDRGFLTWEKHPELGPATCNASGGQVCYSGYDALGHATRRQDGAGDLTVAYDRAERLTRVRDTAGTFTSCLQTAPPAGTARCWTELTYGAGTTDADRSNGKLTVAKRHHHVTLGGTPYNVIQQETVTYGGKAGRPSARTSDTLINAATAATWNQSWVYNDLGDVTSLGYPNASAGSAYAPRTVGFTYTDGWLTGVTGYTAGGGITYHPSGLVAQVAHANGVTWTQAADPNGIARPASIATTGAVTNWSSGTYAYDGAGNPIKIGTSWFVHDPVSRLVKGVVSTTPAGTGTLSNQTYTYDAFGNVQSITTQVGAGTPTARNTPTAAATNRLTSAAYDSAGNLTSWNGQSFVYDPLGQVSSTDTGGGQAWLHFYGADGERIWSYQTAGGEFNRWTLRDLDGKVLREYSYNRPADLWKVERDYVYRHGVVLAANTPLASPNQIHHFHPDHLGSPRLITNVNKTQLAYHAYYPFGEEATSPLQDTERLKFTAHERDLHSLTGAADDLDYMHARYYNPLLARFLSVDSSVGDVFRPQGFNRYAYASGSPVRRIDPDGRTDIDVDIYRYAETQHSTLGYLQIRGTEHGAVTLELPDRANQTFISRIPAGSYPATVVHSKKFNRFVIRLQGTEPRTDILLHPGTRPKHTEGCILVCGRVAGRDLLNADRGRALDRLLLFIRLVQSVDRTQGERTNIWVNIADPFVTINYPSPLASLLFEPRMSVNELFFGGLVAIEGISIAPVP